MSLVIEMFNRRMKEILGDQLYQMHEEKDSESMIQVYRKVI
jgi:hypothetical protein